LAAEISITLKAGRSVGGLRVEESIIVAGFGGQGIVLIGKILAHAALLEGRDVTCLPSYGPEMRGGTANCMIVVSDRKIGSPYVTEPSSLIALNRPSLDLFEPATKLGGCIVANSSMIDRKTMRVDLTTAYVPATGIAERLGDARVANMVALGGFIKARPLVKLGSLSTSMKKVMSTRAQEMLSINEKALLSGFESVSLGE
jgi:2-oxoglutarate ferredoxin oxidoreductase subunit gamma